MYKVRRKPQKQHTCTHTHIYTYIHTHIYISRVKVELALPLINDTLYDCPEAQQSTSESWEEKVMIFRV